jgi:hypothetical protein
VVAYALNEADKQNLDHVIANGVCKFSVDQFGKLEWRMAVPVA